MADDPKVVTTITNPKEVDIDTTPIVESVVKDVTAQITKDVPDKIAIQVTDSIVEKIQGTKETYQPKTWDQVRDDAADVAEKRMDKKFEVQATEQKEAKKQQEELSAKKLEDQNKFWDKQLKDLESDGRIPAMGDDVAKKVENNEKLSTEDMKDPGVKARADIYKLAADKKNANLKEVYYEDYLPEQKGSSRGTTAPVFGSRKSVSQPKGGEYTYEEINKTNIRDILAGD